MAQTPDATPQPEPADAPQFDLATYEGQMGFFDAQWPGLCSAMEDGGPEAAAQFIGGFDPLQRRVLYLYANTGLVNREWEGKNLDDYIALCELGKAELLAQAEAAADEETRAARINVANMLYFNLAADLADCWPGDDELKREQRHFEAGLAAAQQCIAWRDELGRPAANKSTAWWAAGMHELSLGRYADAEQSFTRSLEYAREDAREQGKAEALAARSTFAVILGEGYLALAELKIAQDEERTEDMARAHYGAARAAFDEQLKTPELKDDAQFGLDQLAAVWERYEGK